MDSGSLSNAALARQQQFVPSAFPLLLHTLTRADCIASSVFFDSTLLLNAFSASAKELKKWRQV